MIYIKTNFESLKYKSFNVNDCPYYLLNLSDDIQTIKNVLKSDVVFTNLYSHYDNNINGLLNNEFKIILNELNIVFNKNINLIENRENLLEYILYFINNKESIINKFNNYEIIEIPIFFIKSFYSIFNEYSFIIFKSIYFNKYIDCIYMMKVKNDDDIKISKDNIKKFNNFNDFENFFNEYIEEKLNNYIIKISEAKDYVLANNYYGSKLNNYLKQIELFKEKI